MTIIKIIPIINMTNNSIIYTYLNITGALPPVKLNDGGVLGSNVGVVLGGLKLNPADGAVAGAYKENWWLIF